MTISGIKVIIIKHVSITAMNGMIPFKMTSIGESAIREATKRLIPSGGVINPMAKLVTMIKPKWIGSTPIEAATGIKIGAKIKIAGVVSIKQPTTNNKRLMSKRITILFEEIAIKPLATIVGICSKVITLEKAVAQPKITMVVAVVEQEVLMALMNLAKVNSRWKNTPQTKAYTAATAAASVGVKIPA